MAAVIPDRLRLGALAWLLTLQFFVVETVVQVAYGPTYSRAEDVISLLGASTSPQRVLMNVSFVVQGALIAAGLVLLRPALLGRGARMSTALLGAAAAGVLLVGVFPLDGGPSMHRVGALLYLVGGGLGLIALAYAVRPRSEVLGTILVLLGLVGTASTIFFAAGVVGLLGEGGTERAAAYVLPGGLALAGPALWWLVTRSPGPAGGGSAATGRPGRAALREQERAARAERARERDAALEAAAVRDDDHDPDDPWASPRRRRTS